MRNRVAGVAGLLLAVGLASLSSPSAFAERELDEEPGRAEPAPRKEGEYGGVRPGQRPRAQEGKAARPPRPGTVSWLGFSAQGQTATVWVQAAGELAWAQRVEGRTLIVSFDGVKALARNVVRPIDTRYFDGPVARVSMGKVKARKAHKGQPARRAGVELRIEFENASEAREAAARTAVEADGLWYLYLEVSGAGEAARGGSPDRG